MFVFTFLQVSSIKRHIDSLAESLEEAVGEIPPEIKDLQELGFFKKRCFPFWYVCVLEELALMSERDFHFLFLKAVDGVEDPTWDAKRMLNVVNKDDFLWNLICGPIEKMLEDLGLAGSREVGVCALLKSLERVLEAVLQGYHADMDPSFDWGSDFGLSIITAGSKPAEIDIYPGSFDGGMGSKGIPVRVTLLPGESIVFNGLARHRGVCYPSLNLRFFVSFVVKAAMESAEKEKKEAETNQLEMEDFPEEVGIPFEEWKVK